MSYEEVVGDDDLDEIEAFDNESGSERQEPEQVDSPTTTSAPQASLSTTPKVHTINVNYVHTYSIIKNDDGEVDIPTLLQSLVQHSNVKSPSAQLGLTTSGNTTDMEQRDSNESRVHKRRKLVLENRSQPLYFTALDIPEPPGIRLTDDLDQLIHDWDDSSHITIKRVPIPIKYWSQVYRWASPGTWDVLKDNWSNWKVIISIFEVSVQGSNFTRPSLNFHPSLYPSCQVLMTTSFSWPLLNHIIARTIFGSNTLIRPLIPKKRLTERSGNGPRY